MNSRVDTFLLEQRIFAEMLDSGDLHDLEPTDFEADEFSLMWRLALEAKQVYGGQLDHILLGDYCLRTYGVDKRGWLEAQWERRIGPQNLDAYVQALKDHCHSRTLKRTLHDFLADGGAPGEVREKAIAALRNLAIRGTYRVLDARPVLERVIEDMEERLKNKSLPGVASGIPRLDAKTGGFQKSDLTLIGARPAVGKTALMLCMARHAAEQGHNVGIVSAEQPAEQLMQRLISQVSRIPAWKLRNPRMIQDREWPRLSPAAEKLADLPMRIYDASAPSLADVRIASRELEIEVLFVDYLQRLKAPGVGRYEQISEVALGLKELARDLNVPVVALTQINRAGAAGADMSHLKGSGDQEQEADCVLILERSDGAQSATLTCDKNRHGPTGTIDLQFDPDTMRFESL